jgi:long-chain acyl-CoA synthetase
MYEQFASLARKAPAEAALIGGNSGEMTTRAELLARAHSLSTELATAGLGAGDLLAVQLPNSVDFVATWLAALERRLIFVPIDRDAPETEVGSILTHFGVKGLLYRPDRSSAAIEITIRPGTPRPPLPRNARLVKLTSGSTGQPKGIVASEENLIADCNNICSTMHIAPHDRNLGAIPFSHSYGFSNLVLPLLLQGTAVVISNDYLPQSIIDLSNHYRCTIVPLIPMVFEHLASVPRGHGEFHSIRTFISAGAPLTPASSRRFRQRFGIDIHSFYGCSECGGITYDREGGSVERGSVGSALAGVDLELDGARLIVVSSSVALGYLLDDRTFQPLERSRFVTDDLVERRENGEIVLTGRASDLINTAGKKVNPREVEQVILQLDGVRQAKVYGEPAGARGEVVAAAVVANPDLTREQIREFCRARLSLHKVPRIIKLIESIPVDERGKVKRAALALL